MRDIDRIEPFLEILLKFWKQYPDLRFGQIVQILKGNCKTDFFYLEDDKILEIIEDLIKGEGYMDTKSVIFDKSVELQNKIKQEVLTKELQTKVDILEATLLGLKIEIDSLKKYN